MILTSTEDNEARLRLSGDGNTIAFWRVCVENSRYMGQDLYVIKKMGDSWDQTQKITPAIISVGGSSDAKPALNYSGTRLIYNNNNKTKQKSGDEEYDLITHGRLVMSEDNGQGWSPPVEITDTARFFDTEPN